MCQEGPSAVGAWAVEELIGGRRLDDTPAVHEGDALGHPAGEAHASDLEPEIVGPVQDAVQSKGAESVWEDAGQRARCGWRTSGTIQLAMRSGCSQRCGCLHGQRSISADGNAGLGQVDAGPAARQGQLKRW